MTTPAPMEADEKLVAKLERITMRGKTVAVDMDTTAYLLDLCEQAANRLRQLVKEKDAYAELAADKCVIQKVNDALGQQTLCSSEEYQRMKETIRQLSSKPGGVVREALESVRDIAWPAQGGRTIFQLSDDMAEIVKISEQALQHLEASGWRDIASAPNETKILLWHEGSKFMERGPVIGHMMQTALVRMPVFGCTVYSVGDATAWQPLPSPPERSTDGGGK